MRMIFPRLAAAAGFVLLLARAARARLLDLPLRRSHLQRPGNRRL